MTCTRCNHHILRQELRCLRHTPRSTLEMHVLQIAFFSEPQRKADPRTPFLHPIPKAAERALHCLLEWCSIRSTERLTGP